MVLTRRRRYQRKLTRRFLNARAGALIGKGAYGCGFYPGARCRNSSQSYHNYVSKLVSVRTAKEELSLVRPLLTIDPRMKYTVYPIEACYPADQTNAERSENPFASCTHVSSGATVLLQSPYAGKSLHSFTPPDITHYVAFMESWANLLEGLDVLHRGDFAHLDIKLPNIVTLCEKLQDPKRYSTRYIDFGLSVVMDQLPNMSDMKSTVYASPYVVWPYETRFLCTAFQESHITNESVSYFVNNILKYDEGFLPPGIYTNIQRTVTYTVDHVLEMWSMYQSLSQEDRLRHIAMATDIYSLGLALATVYAKITGHFCGFGDSIHFQQYNKHPHTDAAFWEPRMGSRIYEWNRMVADDVSVPFYALCRQMMAPLPFNRPDGADAHRIYKTLLPSIRDVFHARGQNGIRMSEALGHLFGTRDHDVSISIPLPPSPLDMSPM